MQVRALGVAALLLVGIAGWMSRFEVQDDDHIEDGASVIMALELPRSADKLEKLVGSLDPTKREDRKVWSSLSADTVLILSYWLFLSGCGWLSFRRQRPWSGILCIATVAAATAAAICDLFENQLILQALDHIDAIDEPFTSSLRRVSQAKWLTFFTATGLASAAFLGRRGFIKLLGAVILLSAICGITFIVSDWRVAITPVLGALILTLLPTAVMLICFPACFFDPPREINERPEESR